MAPTEVNLKLITGRLWEFPKYSEMKQCTSESPQVQEEGVWKIKKHFQLNENENSTRQHLWGAEALEGNV